MVRTSAMAFILLPFVVMCMEQFLTFQANPFCNSNTGTLMTLIIFINYCVLFQTSIQSSRPATDSLKVCFARTVDHVLSKRQKELSVRLFLLLYCAGIYRLYCRAGAQYTNE